MSSWKSYENKGNRKQNSEWQDQQPSRYNESNSSWGRSRDGAGRERNPQHSYDSEQRWGSNISHAQDRTNHDRQFTRTVPKNNNVPQMNQKIARKQQKQSIGYYGAEKKTSRDAAISTQSQEETKESSNDLMDISKMFFEMTIQEKINSQFPDNQAFFKTFEDIPPECQFQFGDDKAYNNFCKKRKKAAELAAEKALLLYHQKTSTEDGKRKVPDPDIGPEEIKLFCDALQHNMIFDMGWQVFGFNLADTEICWCPCSKHMEPWQLQFKLTSIAGKGSEAYCSSKGSRKMGPMGLMGHIDSMSDSKKSISSQVLHYGIRVYLKSVYGDLNDGIGHKCLHKMGDENYKKAEAYEKKAYNRDMMKLKNRNYELNRMLEEQKRENEANEQRLKKLGEVSSDLLKKIQKLEKDKEALDVKGKRESKKISEKDFEINNNLRKAFFKNLHTCNDATATKPLVIVVPSTGFSLCDFFKDNTCNGTVFSVKADKTFLFRELSYKNDPHFHASKLILDWKIQFQSFAKRGEKTMVHEGKKINIDKAEDEGGPTREFFSLVWKQLESLKVSVPTRRGVKDFELFERCPAGVIPKKDEQFEIFNDEEMTLELKERARYYYRAIGRIMFRSLVTNHPISSEAMPTFFRNVILRDCRPEERKEEHREDIIDELYETGVEKDCFDPQQWIDSGSSIGIILGDERKEIITKENVFTIIIPEVFVDSRNLAIHSMKEGLTLNGAVDVFSLFSLMPLPVVSLLIFSKPTVVWDDLKRVLKPKYSSNADRTTKENQMYFFNDIFLKVLKERGGPPEEKEHSRDDNENNFLSAFVHFCTGLYYLPSKEANPDFTINIEFESDEDEMTKKSLPKVHTCTHDFMLPRCAYDLDKELFEKKMIQAIEQSADYFGMR